MADFESKMEKLVNIIGGLLERKQYAQLKGLLLPMESADIALLMDELSEQSIPILFRLLPKELAAEVFVELDPEYQEQLIKGFTNTELKEVLDELYLDDTVDIIEEMPANVVRRILAHSEPDMRKSINEILKYPEDSAGSLMTTEFIDLKRDMTVEDCFKRIRRNASDVETINVCYVVDKDRKLRGYVTIRDLFLSDYEDVIGEIMDTNLIAATTLDDQETVAQRFGRYDFLAMPVVDTEGRLVGIITADDVMDVIQEEATEDMEKMAAMLPSDKPYLRTGIWETWKSRIPWLMLLMLSATFTSLIITKFEGALASCMILTSFITVLSGTGGNSGSQTSVAVIRALSLKEVRFSDMLIVIWKEIRVAVVCGVTLAAANFVKMMLVDRMLFNNPEVTPLVAAVVCVTLLFTVVAAKTVGAILPMLADKVGLDPAVMASPFITTIVDALSLLIYFAVATSLIPM
ncbi:MAG: magnesium transporter [Oscillospiraceae bacterium]|nr:magnesium transporter [Oscillospiraceae bacterium]